MEDPAEQKSSERPVSPGRRMGLHRVFPTEPSSETAVDIVAIHGLDTESSKTWIHWENNNEKNPGKTVNWLSDPAMLPAMVPKARIFTYDYNASYYKKAPLQNLLSLVDVLLDALLNERKTGNSATKQIIFIGSCFGGVLLEKALLRASEEGSEYKSILSSTCGVIFLASPLRGCKAAEWAKQLEYFARILGAETSDALIRDLDGKSHVLQDMLQHFSEMANREPTRLPIHCFFETMQSKIFHRKEFLVDMESACIDGVRRTGLEVKHVMMNMFFHPEDQNFQLVARRIQKFIDGAQEVIAKRRANSSDANQKSSRNTHWMVGRSSTSFLTGRDVEIQMIETALRTPQQTAQGQPGVFLVTGKGGQGKTELCLKVAENLRDEFWGVFWVDVSTTDAAQMGFAAINSKINSSLANTDEKWLLILDNANNPDFDYTAHVPPGNQGSVLITSRNVDFQLGHATVRSLHLYPFGMSQSLELLQKAAAKEEPKTESARGVAGLLDFNPFALVQAGTYIARSKQSIGQCLTEFGKHSGADCNTLRSIDQPELPHNTIHAPLEAIARRLDYHHGAAGRDALKLLSVMCMLHHSSFPVDSFQDAWNASRNAEAQGTGANLATDDLSQLRHYRRTNFHESFLIEEAVGILASYSLVLIHHNSENERAFCVSPLIQEWVQDRQNASEQLSSWIMAGSVMVMSRVWSDVHPTHAYALLHVRSRVLNQHPGPLPRRLANMVTAILCQIVRLLAQKDYKQADDPRLVAVIDDIFCIMDTNPLLGPFKDLVPLFRGCISMAESPYRINSLVALLEKNVILRSPGKNWHLHLAKAYFRIGQPRKSARLLKILIKDHTAMPKSDLFIAQAFLAAAYHQTGQLRDAISHQQHAIRTAQAVLPPTDPCIWSNVVFLGWLLGEAGHVDAAFQTLEYALRSQDALYGTANDCGLVTRHYLSGLCRRHGELPRAVQWQREAVALWRRRGVADAHPLRLRAERSLATSYLMGRQYREAERLLVGLVEVYWGEGEEERPGGDFVEVLWGLGICLQETGRLGEARRVVGQVVWVLEAGSVERGRAEELLAEIGRRMGRVDRYSG